MSISEPKTLDLGNYVLPKRLAIGFYRFNQRQVRIAADRIKANQAREPFDTVLRIVAGIDI